MRNSEKEELTKIVKQIPETELGEKVSILHRRYAPSFGYNTFREYLHTFRKDEKGDEVEPNIKIPLYRIGDAQVSVVADLKGDTSDE